MYVARQVLLHICRVFVLPSQDLQTCILARDAPSLSMHAHALEGVVSESCSLRTQELCVCIYRPL